MVISELALGLFTNLLYESFKNIPEYISDTSSKVYDKAIEEFSNKNYKLTGIQIDTFFHQENVEKAIKKYLKNPNKLDCSNILINEFFELFSEEDFSREDADLILNSFFEIIDAEIEKEPELILYLDHYLEKEIFQKVDDIHKKICGNNENQDKKESGVDFEKSLEKYLNKIIDEDGKNGVSEVYTELSAKEILPVTLKFHDKESNRPQEFEVLELIKKEDKLIISGESGSGKTSTLKWLNFIHATSYLEKKEGIIPLYVELNTYIEGSFYDYVKIKANRKGISEEILKTILKGKAIILIDGLDLLSSNNDFRPYHQISNFVSTYSNCRFVISSRPGFFESIESDFKVSELEKLTDEKIQEFIDKYVSDKEFGKTIKNKILNDQRLKSLLTTPMMLHLAIEVAMERKGNMEELFPSNRYEMYEAFVSGLFTHYGTKNGKIHCAERSQIEIALTNLYFELQCRKAFSCKYEKAKEIVEEDTLEKCFKLGLLVENDSEIEYGIHQSFQEYYAAIKLKKLFESGYDVSEAFNHPKWEEVVIFTSEMLDSDLLNEYVDLMVSKGELFLASKCVNKASNNTKEKLCALLADKLDSGYKLEKINSIESLERIGNIGAGIIVKTLNDKNKHVRCKAAETLGNVEFKESVDSLICALNDENEDVRAEAAIALGKIRSEKAVESLICLLKDEYVYVRLGTIFALGEIKVKKAVEPLVHALNDEDEDVRVYAVEALRKIKPDRMWEKMGFIPDDEEDINTLDKVSIVIENSNSEITVGTTICALKNEDRYMRLGTTENFREINQEEVIEILFRLLKDKDENIRWKTAQLLGTLKLEKAIDPLISILNDESANVKAYTAQALGQIRSEKAVKPLINVLKDESEFVREFVAESLGNICTVKNRAQLEDLLESDHEYSANTAFEILYEIEKEERSKVILFKDEKFLKT